MREEPSRQGSTHVDEEPRSSRSRAYSHDAGVDAMAEATNTDEPRAVRSALKKPKESVAYDVYAGDDPEIQESMRIMREHMQKVQEKLRSKGENADAGMGMMLNQMLTSKPNEQEPEPSKKAPVVDFGQDDEAAATEVVRPRRLSNPRAPMELPTGMSWEYPMTKEDKKARLVSIAVAENESLQEENEALQEEVRKTVKSK